MATEILAQLPQLELLCERLYTSQDPAERTHAEQYLRVFSLSTEYVSHCKALLDSSQSPYAQLLASSSLIKVVTEHSLSMPVKLEMRNYFLSFLDSRGACLEAFVVTSVVQLLCRTTKLCWYDDDAFRNIVEDAKCFLDKGSQGESQGHYLLGLRILNMLVTEMNQPTPGRTLTQHRKIAVSFRDESLLQVFTMALLALRQLQSSQSTEEKLREQAITLALQCMSYDFVGTCLDESSEDLGTIQVPSTWRPLIEDPSTLQLMLDFYSVTKPPLSSIALECLVRLASVRRSLFSNEAERAKFLNHLARGTRELLRSQQGLAEHANYHEFCRLLGRLKTNYQLSELVNVDQYGEWIQLVADFTVSSLHSWQWASGSVFYLLGLWSRLVSSMPYLKSDSPSLLETYVPNITEAYISSRLESVRAVLESGGEDPLENEEQLTDQMDALPFLCRFQYERTCLYLVALMDPLLVAYTAAASNPGDSMSIALLEGRLTWLVHIVGAIIRGRLSSSSAESQETIDGDLSARVFGLLKVVDTGAHAQRYTEHSRQRLDTAILSFFQSFRKVYIGEQVMHASKVYTRLAERLGLSDHLMVLNVMLAKIATNLKAFGSCEDVVEQTLTLFQDLAAGYMSGKLLLKLEAVAFILANHNSENFTFLEEPGNSRARSLFYHTLARLLFMEDTPAKFKTFVAPLQQVLVALAAASSGGSAAAALRSTVPKQTVVGLFRDLRGITLATNSRRTYGLSKLDSQPGPHSRHLARAQRSIRIIWRLLVFFTRLVFDWLYPAHFPTILACLGAWADTPDVSTPILKFVAEFVMNKTQRLAFDASSASGILLFREVSKVLVTYGKRVLPLQTVSDPYSYKYKGIWLCLAILTRALSGNYVNFGVFDLYGDPALKDALEVALQMALSMPLADIMAFRKVGKAYFGLLDVLCHSHPNAIATCDTATFTFLVSSLDAGLKSLDVSVSSQCAAAIDNLASYYLKHAIGCDAPSPTAQALGEHLRQRPELFPAILTTLFEIALFENCSNQWSLSRPMLALILLNEQIYQQLQQQVISSQPADRQAQLSISLQGLMSDVQRNLEPKNRDKFTQNLTAVRQEFRVKI